MSNFQTSVTASGARSIQKSWITAYRSVLWQMVMLEGALSLVGPSMNDAISNLGGGGLSTPWLGNLANSLNYGMGFLVTTIGGPLINKFSIKWSCFIAAITMPLNGSGYYVNVTKGIEWYLLLAQLIKGATSGFLYVAESTAMMSYPDPSRQGLYLSIWAAMRNTGAIIGGGINFANNHTNAKAGAVAASTYLIFVAFECTGVVYALLLSQTRKVRRRDGTSPALMENASWGEEFGMLWKTMKMRKTLFMAMPAFYSFFCGGVAGTYLTTHFSVRARALSSLILPLFTILSVLLYGKILDRNWGPLRRRAWVGFLVCIIPQIACYIWMAIEYSILPHKIALDYAKEPGRWARAYFPYLIIFSSCYWTQLSLYWILGTFSADVNEAARTGGLFRAFETAGQAVSYGLNARKSMHPTIGLYINIGILAATCISMRFLMKEMPEAHVTIGVPQSGKEEESGIKQSEMVVVKKL